MSVDTMERLKYDSDDDGQIEVLVKKYGKGKEVDLNFVELNPEELTDELKPRTDRNIFMMYDSDHDDSIIEEPTTDSPTNNERVVYDSDDDGQVEKILKKIDK